MRDLCYDFFDGHLWTCPFPSSSLFPFPWACHVQVFLDPVLFRAVSRGVFLATRAVRAVPALSREASPARFSRFSGKHPGSCQAFLCDEKTQKSLRCIGFPVVSSPREKTVDLLQTEVCTTPHHRLPCLTIT